MAKACWNQLILQANRLGYKGVSFVSVQVLCCENSFIIVCLAGNDLWQYIRGILICAGDVLIDR